MILISQIIKQLNTDEHTQNPKCYKAIVTDDAHNIKHSVWLLSLPSVYAIENVDKGASESKVQFQPASHSDYLQFKHKDTLHRYHGQSPILHMYKGTLNWVPDDKYKIHD